MSLNLSLDLSSATLADVGALLAAAKSAGASDDTGVRVEGSTLHVEVNEPRENAHPPRESRPSSEHSFRPARHDRTIGESTIRSIVDLINDRID